MDETKKTENEARPSTVEAERRTPADGKSLALTSSAFWWRKARLFAILGILVGGFLFVWARLAPAPRLGVQPDGQLAPCPPSPNAVSTFSDRKDQRMPPISFSSQDPMADITRILEPFPRVRIVESENDYLRAEFRSLVFGFVDDVEFLIDRENEKIHFRSASRIGHSDLGVNRRRMEQLTQLISGEK